MHQLHFSQTARLHRTHFYCNSNQCWDYLSEKSIIHQLCFSKSPRFHRSCLYINPINTGTIQSRSQLFINFVSPKLQDCTGVTYTDTQSTLELFKLEVNYSSTLFQQNSKVAQELLIHQPNQYWNYLSQKSFIHQLCFTKIARLYRSHLYSNPINTGTI